MRSQPDKKVSLDKLNRLIGSKKEYLPNHSVDFENGEDIIYDDAAEDKKYFYRNLGMKLGYSREYVGAKQTSFIEYDYNKNVDKARSRQNSFIDKENQFNKANTPLKLARSSKKVLTSGGKMMTPKKRSGSIMSNPGAQYTPSISPVK